MKDYKAIFNGIESTVIDIGSRKVSLDGLRLELEPYKHLEGKIFRDDEYYTFLVHIIFYCGFRAQTVTDKLSIIDHYFPDYRVVAGYGPNEIQPILSDTRMIRHPGKIQACVQNAKIFKELIGRHGSFRNYLDSFGSPKSEANLVHLKEDLERRFAWLGGITSYHFLTDVGMPVLKPDRVLRRIFTRLGVIEEGAGDREIVEQGRKFAEATGLPIRYIDIVFVAYGQVQTKELGLEHGICLETSPSCSVCGVTGYCNHYARTRRTGGA